MNITKHHSVDARRHHAAYQLLAAAQTADPAILLLARAMTIGISAVARDVLLIRLTDSAAPLSVTGCAGLLGVAPDAIRQSINELFAARLLQQLASFQPCRPAGNIASPPREGRLMLDQPNRAPQKPASGRKAGAPSHDLQAPFGRQRPRNAADAPENAEPGVSIRMLTPTEAQDAAVKLTFLAVICQVPRIALAVLGMRLRDPNAPFMPEQAAMQLGVMPEDIQVAIDQLTRAGFLDGGLTPIHPDVVMARLKQGRNSIRSAADAH